MDTIKEKPKQRKMNAKKCQISFTFSKTSGADVQRCLASEGGVEIPSHRFQREKPEVAIEEISREEAEEILRYYNIANRDTSPNYSKMYSAEFLAGDWKFNGEAIKFANSSAEGVPYRLLDGQNRLAGFCMACESAEEEEAPLPTFKTVVAMGLEDGSQKKMDRNFKRSIKNLFQFSDKTAVNNSAYSLACRILKHLRENEVLGLVSDRDVEKAFKKYGESINYTAGEMIKGVNGTRNMSVNVPICMYHIANPEKAKDFIHKLVTGEGLDKGDPILLLRNFIQQQRGYGSGNGKHMISTMGKTVAAMFAHRFDKKSKQLRLYKNAHKDVSWIEFLRPDPEEDTEAQN